MIEVIILAIALSMDAFAVSIGLGAKKYTPELALKAGLFFGVFQALMPLIGYLGGQGVLGWVENYRASCKTPKLKIPDLITHPFWGDF